MNTRPFLLALSLLVTTVVSVVAPAQRVNERLSEENRARLARNRATVIESDKFVTRGYAHLARREYAEAELAADRALAILEADDDRDLHDRSARGLLQEIHVAQGLFAAALEDLPLPEIPDPRDLANRALALIGSGRTEEARGLLVHAVGDRDLSHGLPGDRADLPMTKDASSRALAATAYLVRMADRRGPGLGSALADGGTVRRLAPRSVVAAIFLARVRREAGDLDLALRDLEGMSGGGEETRRALDREREAISRARGAKVQP